MNKYILLSNANYLETKQCYYKVKEYIKPNSKVVCIPFACSPVYLFKECNRALSYNGDFFTQHYNHFIEYGISKDNFYVANPTDTTKFIKWKLEHCDIVYLSGGSMKVFKFMLQSFGLWDTLKNIKDKVMILESAGVLISQDDYIVFKDDLPFECKGLGLIDNVSVFVHYDKDSHENLFNEFKRFSDCRIKQKLLYAVADDGALIVDENKIIKIGNVYE